MNLFYSCKKCGYKTNRLLNFKRHELRKISCSNKIEAPIGKVLSISNNNDASISSLQCTKCLKVFSRKDKLKMHDEKCEGIHKLQCKVCLKMFTTQQGKWQHTQYVKCNPPIQQTINSNNNITNITNNNNNNTTNNNNNTINIRVDFGNECLKRLCTDKEYVCKMIENINLGKYAIPKSIEEIYFNDKYPENQTLKKERKNDKMVSIQYNGKWETRFYEDIIDDLVKKTEEYHETYFKDLYMKYEDSERDREFRKMMIPLRRFATRMLWFGWKCNDIRRLGIDLDEDTHNMDDEDFKNMFEYQKQMKELMIDKIYEKSGDFIS
jgi:hypothetical protein